MIYFLSLFFAIKTLEAVLNEGKECWLQCNRISGDCGFCGGDGACCRKGHESERYPECGGRGSIYAHVCVKRQNPDDAVDIHDGCKKCVNVDGWPCFNPQDDTNDKDLENSLPCVAADHETRKCAKGLVDCRTHIDETDYEPTTCTGERHDQYKLYAVKPEASEINGPTVNRDSTPWGVRDWDRFLFSTIVEGQKVPTSMRLVVRWKDQGWGNRKGSIRICYRGRIHQVVPVMASHYLKTYTVEVGDGVFYDWAENSVGKNYFNEELHFSYVVGGGSGHTLTIESLKVSFGYDTLPQPFTYGVCKEENRYFPVVLGRSCQQFCWRINKQCKKAEREARGSEYCVEEEPKRDFGCESTDETRLICTCEESDEPVPTPRPTLEPGHKDVYTRVWPFMSLLGHQGVKNVWKSVRIKVTGQSTAHIAIEALGPVDMLDIYGDELRNTSKDRSSLKVAVSGKNVTPKTIVEVNGREWLGDYEYHFEEDDEVQFLIYTEVRSSNDLYSVDLRVDHARELKDEDDWGDSKDNDKKDMDGCGYLAKKITWDNAKIVKKASSNKKIQLTACDCRDLCESAPSKAWSFQIKREKCMCYGPKEEGKPLVIKKISGNGKKAKEETAKVIVSHKKKGEL